MCFIGIEDCAEMPRRGKMTDILELRDVHVSVGEKEIVKGITITLQAGKTYALMGPNGSGKSSLAHALMGHPRYKITRGQILLNKEDITHLPAHQKARKGLFLSFQYPVEVTGVTLSNFLRTALNSLHEKKISVVEFHQFLKKKMKDLDMDSSFGSRYLNEGFSGGEKKRAEILQMSVLEPKFAILDETDSGLDVDSLKIVASGISKMKSPSRCMLLITHYNRILDYIVPDEVFVMRDGKIIASGGKDLALKIEKNGYDFLYKKTEVKP